MTKSYYYCCEALQLRCLQMPWLLLCINKNVKIKLFPNLTQFTCFCCYNKGPFKSNCSKTEQTAFEICSNLISLLTFELGNFLALWKGNCRLVFILEVKEGDSALSNLLTLSNKRNDEHDIIEIGAAH